MNTVVAGPVNGNNAVLLPHVQQVLKTAEQELSGLLEQRADVMKRIGTIKQMLAGLADLFGDQVLDDELRVVLDRGMSDRRKGFTRACRQVLMEAQTPLRPRQGCEALWQKFPELARRHKDLGASVTTVFHRLVAYGEARCFLDEQGIRVWELVAEPNAGGVKARLAALESSQECRIQP